ncbi:unnamed protein product [Gongylonema pulchrum]|uniref:Ovule protein n=1 Tax=Gongylonema pulchrum TaxID=637853 RepID=A0A183DI02_9BILA|nr:unnamed protein product [Gongylonema pulchrum]
MQCELLVVSFRLSKFRKFTTILVFISLDLRRKSEVVTSVLKTIAVMMMTWEAIYLLRTIILHTVTKF